MKILILGATGKTGKHLLELALEAGHEVTALVRDPSKNAIQHPKLRIIQGSATAAADLEAAARGQYAVISALGPRTADDPVCRKAAEAATTALPKAGVKRVIWISAAGAGDSKEAVAQASFIFGRIILPLFLSKPYANHALAEAALRASALEWTVVRPMRLVDSPAGKEPQAALPGEKIASLKIGRRDVARFILRELQTGTYLRRMPLVFS